MLTPRPSPSRAHVAPALALCSLALAGCPDRTIAELPPKRAGEISKDIPVEAAIDLLFVIDDSRSTRDKQTVFAQNFPGFVSALEAFEEGLPNLHIGVVSTSVDLGASGYGTSCPHPNNTDDGRLRNDPGPGITGCTGPRDRYISDVAQPGGGRVTNYSGTLSSTLSCIAQRGANGCGFEAPLEAMKRALDGRHPANAGFLRDGAFLVVVFLVDEDDASAVPGAFSTKLDSDFPLQPQRAYRCDRPIGEGSGTYEDCRVRTDVGSPLVNPASYYTFLSSLKPPGRTIVALIGGDPTAKISVGKLTLPDGTQEPALLPSCEATINSTRAVGRPANRLMDFVSRFGERGLFRSVCQSDYTKALADISSLIATAVSPCLEGSLDRKDIDAANPGTQLECTVADTTGDLASVEQAIPPCQMTNATTPSAGARPCWWTAETRAACPTTATGLELRIERASPPPPGTSVRVRCATGEPGEE